MKRKHVEGLLYQALETEIGGASIYEAALEAAVHDGLIEEWTEYLEQTQQHREHLLAVFEDLGLDPELEHPARELIRDKAAFLVDSIHSAIELLDPDAAQIVAGECVTEAETKDHLNWTLLQHVAENGPQEFKRALADRVAAVITEEAHHVFHTRGWTRELWIAHLGFPAALPPPEEVKSVQTQIGAGRAELQRERYSAEQDR